MIFWEDRCQTNTSGLFEMSQIYVEPIPGDQREMHAGCMHVRVQSALL